jgi:hypothetical protein
MSATQKTVEDYKLSSDYGTLLRLICEGKVIAAFTDYRLSADSEHGDVARDICSVQRRGPYQIKIGVRGMEYAGLYPFNKKDGPEHDLFVQMCSTLNLKWIEPLNTRHLG